MADIARGSEGADRPTFGHSRVDTVIEGGIVKVAVAGILDADAAAHLGGRLRHALHGRGGPASILADMRGLGYVSPQARKYLGAAVRDLRGQRWAVFGQNAYVGALLLGILRVSGGSRVRFFRDEDEARAWLQEP